MSGARPAMDPRAARQTPPLATRVVTERLVLRAPRTTDVPELRRVLRANAAHLRPWSVAPAPGTTRRRSRPFHEPSCVIVASGSAGRRS